MPKDLGKDQATLKAPFADQANAWDSQDPKKQDPEAMPCIPSFIHYLLVMENDRQCWRRLALDFMLDFYTQE
jgi:hypothetical protein